MEKNHEWLRDVGPGWEKIVFPLLAYCDAYGIKILQVKEKFGGLRFYYQVEEGKFGGNPGLDNLIQAAEIQAYKTCEWCGAPGERTKNTDKTANLWIKTLCPMHTTDWFNGARWWIDKDGKHV